MKIKAALTPVALMGSLIDARGRSIRGPSADSGLKLAVQQGVKKLDGLDDTMWNDSERLARNVMCCYMRLMDRKCWKRVNPLMDVMSVASASIPANLMKAINKSLKETEKFEKLMSGKSTGTDSSDEEEESG